MGPNMYMNPSAIKPNMGETGVPMGALGGMFIMRDRDMYEKQMGLQQMLQQIEAAKQQEDFVKGAPVRDAKRSFELSDYGLKGQVNNAAAAMPDYGPTMARGQMGEAQSNTAKGRIDTETAQGKIDFEQMENKSKQWEHAANQLNYIASMNPAMAQGEYMSVLQSLPEGVRKHFPAQFEPSVPGKIKQLSEAVMKNIAQQRAAALQKQQDDAALERTKRTAQATEYSADQRYLAAIDSALARISQTSNKQNFQQMVTQFLQQEVAAGRMTREDAFKKLQQVMINNQQAPHGQIDPRELQKQLFPGVEPRPAPAPVPLNPEAQQPTPQAQEYIVDKVYPGKTGNYKYKGGDVKDPKNWEKVS